MIKIQYEPGRIGWAVYEYRVGANGYKEFKDNKGDWKQAVAGTLAEPTLYIEDLTEWAEAIRDAGVKLPSDHKLEGVLEAQSQHLQDMRRLVFQEQVIDLAKAGRELSTDVANPPNMPAQNKDGDK